MKKVPLLAPLLLAVTLLLGACTGTPDKPPPIDPSAAEVRGFIEENRLTDRRGRFREIFCTVLKEHGPALPDYRPCEEALNYVGREKGATGEPVALTQSRKNYLFLLVPGLGWNCFEEWLDLSYSVPRHVARFGYEVRLVPVDDLGDGPRWRRQVLDLFGSLDVFVTANPYVASLLGADYRVVRPITLVDEADRVPVNGTMVRREMARGDGWKPLVPRDVADYITGRGLDARFRREFGLETLAFEAP